MTSILVTSIYSKKVSIYNNMLPFIIWAHTFHSVKLFVNFFVRNFHKFLSWMLFWLLLNSYLFHASLFLLLLLYFQSLFYDQSVICYWICSNIIAMFSSQGLQALGGVFSILPQSLVSCLFSLCHRFMSPYIVHICPFYYSFIEMVLFLCAFITRSRVLD